MAEVLSPTDAAVDHALAGMAASVRFLLEITPVDADQVREAFLDGVHAGQVNEPEFTYRELTVDPDVLDEMLAGVDLGSVEDPTVGQLLRARHREMGLQVEMLRARCSDDFRNLSQELYGTVPPSLRDAALDLIDRLPKGAAGGDKLTPEEFLALAQAEIDHYRSIDPDVGIHAEIRSDVSGVLVEGSTLLISDGSAVAAHRAEALIHHEVGTHLVTQVNGSGQPIETLATGLAGYEETQESLAVLAEIACGGLTPSRLRQLAARVVAVDAMVNGATFVETWQRLVDSGSPAGSAFITTMRVHRSGGLTKDAIYLRGVIDLLCHLRDGGTLDLFWLGKFSLRDLPLITDLHDRDLLRPARIVPRYLTDAANLDRLHSAAASEDLTTLVSTPGQHTKEIA